MLRTITTALIDRNSLFREGLQRILAGTRFRIIASGPSFEQLRIPSAHKHRPMLLVICSDHASSATIAEIERARAALPLARIAVLVQTFDTVEMRLSFRAGVNAYFRSTIRAEALVRSLDLIATEDMMIAADLSAVTQVEVDPIAADELGPPEHLTYGVLADEEQLPAFSSREMAILDSLARGDSNKQIARCLSIAEATVKVHVRGILRKIRAQNRTQAAVWALGHRSPKTPEPVAPGVPPDELVRRWPRTSIKLNCL